MKVIPLRNSRAGFYMQIQSRHLHCCTRSGALQEGGGCWAQSVNTAFLFFQWIWKATNTLQRSIDLAAAIRVGLTSAAVWVRKALQAGEDRPSLNFVPNYNHVPIQMPKKKCYLDISLFSYRVHTLTCVNTDRIPCT